MAYLVGVVLALFVSVFARVVGLDRDRGFYPTVLAVVASYYDLFAVMGGSMQAMLAELLVTTVFLVTVVLGFRRNLWIVVGALVAHGLLDFVHDHLISNPGVPPWWPMFCLAYDVTAAAWLARLLHRSELESGRHRRLALACEPRLHGPPQRWASLRSANLRFAPLLRRGRNVAP